MINQQFPIISNNPVYSLLSVLCNTHKSKHDSSSYSMKIKTQTKQKVLS